MAIDYKKFPWLCPTTGYDFNQGEESSIAGNIVKDSESITSEETTTDAYGKFGLKLLYYKVSLDTQKDEIYGEDTLHMIERSFYFNGYVEQIPPNVRTYQLEGIWGEDVITMYVGKTAFKYWSTYGGEDKNTPEVFDDIEPRIGDVIYFEVNDTFYEIRDVKNWSDAFGLAQHTYTITLKVYKDTKMTIDTDNETLKNINDPIYKVASSKIREAEPMHDDLSINRYLEEITKEGGTEAMNPLWEDRSQGEKRIDPFDGW